MSTTDLNILADAVTFAMMVTLGGIIVYAVARSTWKRHALRRSLKVGLSVAALVAVGIAGVAVWPAAREGVNTAAGVDLDESGDVIVPPEELELALEGPSADLDHTKVSARPARLREVASVGTDSAIDPAPTSGAGGTGGGGGGGGTGGGGGGGDGGGGGGGGVDPSPTDEPSPTVDPSPTDEPSPTVDPSPTDEPSPTVDPSPTDEPSPTVDPSPTEPPPPPPGV